MQESSEKSTEEKSESRVAVLDFLKTAIVVDDKIGSECSIANEKAALTQLQSMSQPPSQKSVSDSGPAKSTEELFPKFETIARSFFDMGVLCSLHKPTFPNGDVRDEVERIVKACESADIIILDWYLKDGDKRHEIVPDIMKALLESDKKSGEIATHDIFVYSCEAVDVGAAFKEHGMEVESNGGGLYLLGNSQIQVLTKTEVPEDRLANRIVDCLVKRYAGVMPSFALAGISAVRRNTKRILSRFNGYLDPELTLHAILTREENDIKEQLVELLSEEIKPILEDDGKLMSSDSIYSELSRRVEDADWGSKSFLPIALFVKKESNKVFADDVKSAVVKYLKGGKEHEDGLTALFENCEKVSRCKNKSFLRALKDLVVKSGSKNVRFGRFSALMSHRASYTTTKVLRNGTIVDIEKKKGCPHQYVCVMPTCNCRRFKVGDEITFPFWKLETTGGAGADCFSVWLENGKDKPYKQLFCKGNISQNLHLETIKVNGSCCLFTDGRLSLSENRTMVWRAQLKDFHSQRILNFVGKEFSKVGLLEEDWSRRMAVAEKDKKSKPNNVG